jgi:hypothetical protein
VLIGMVVEGADARERVSVADAIDVDCWETGITVAVDPIENEPATASSRITLSVTLPINTATFPILT